MRYVVDKIVMFAKTLLQYCFYSHPSLDADGHFFSVEESKLDSELLFSHTWLFLSAIQLRKENRF